MGDDLGGATHLEPGAAIRVERLGVELQNIPRCDESTQSKRSDCAQRRRSPGGQGAQRQIEKPHSWKDRASREVSLVERSGRRNLEAEPRGAADGQRGTIGRAFRLHARTAVIAATTKAGQTSRIRAMSG